MGDFNRTRIREVSDKIQTFLDKLSKEEGIQMTMAGGKFSADSFTLKIDGKLLAEDGSRVVSKATNIDADLAARRDGISYSTPHFIGSVWRFSSSGLVRVEEYSSKNRRYPYICSVYGESKRIKATALSFSSEVKMPDAEKFFIWFTTDVEEDCVTQADEEICDNVNDFVSVRFDGVGAIDKFYDLCGEYFDKYIADAKRIPKGVEALCKELYKKLIVENNVTAAVDYLAANL